MINDTSSKNLKVGLGIAIALFVCAAILAAVLFSQKNTNEKIFNQNQKVLKEEKAKVLGDLTEMAARYDVAMTDNEVANQHLVEAKGRIQGLIDSLSISENNIKSLWRYKSKFLSLKDEMTNLLTENDQLRVKNQSLTNNLNVAKIELEESSNFVDSLYVQNLNLANVVENAAVLSANSLNVNGVIERSSGKQIPTERAKRSDKLRICFTIAKNKLVEAGDKELYIQVIDPENTVLGTNNTLKLRSKSINYSLVSKFNYENSSLPICEYLAKKSNKEGFNKGVYKVNIFNGKELITNTEFSLR